MPKQRPIIESGIKAPEVKTSFPRFSDGYVPGAAARGASSQLEQLARGLESFNRSVTPVLSRLREEQIVKEEKEGVTMAITGEELPEDAARHVKIGFAQAKGDANAHEAYQNALAEVAARRESGDTVSPEDWQEIYDTELANVNAQSPALLEDDEFINANAETANTLRRGEGQNIARQYTDDLSDNANKLRERDLNMGISFQMKQEDIPATAIIEDINTEVDRLIQIEGVKPRLAYRMAYRALTAQVQATDDLDRQLEMIEAMKQLKDAEGPIEFNSVKVLELEALEAAVVDKALDKEVDAKNFTALRVDRADRASLDVLTDVYGDPTNPPDSDTLTQIREDARAAGGGEAVDFVDRYIEGQKERARRGEDGSDPVAMRRFLVSVMSGEVSRADADIAWRSLAASGKLSNSDIIRTRTIVDNMPAEGFDKDLDGQIDRDLRRLHFGGDLMPGSDPAQFMQYQKARKVYEDKFQELGGFDTTDPVERNRIQQEAFGFAQETVPSLLMQIATDDPAALTEERLAEFPLMAQDDLSRVKNEIMGLGGVDAITVRDLSKETRDLLEDYDFFLGGEQRDMVNLEGYGQPRPLPQQPATAPWWRRNADPTRGGTTGYTHRASVTTGRS
jgi:hypothetical protein